jgi:hypothetical protein
MVAMTMRYIPQVAAAVVWIESGLYYLIHLKFNKNTINRSPLKPSEKKPVFVV